MDGLCSKTPRFKHQTAVGIHPHQKAVAPNDHVSLIRCISTWRAGAMHVIGVTDQARYDGFPDARPSAVMRPVHDVDDAREGMPL